MARKMNRQRKKTAEPTQRRVLLPLGILAVCVLIVFIIAMAALQRKVDGADRDRFLNGVSIGGVDLSGMTEGQARAALQEELQRIGTEKLLLTIPEGEQEETTLTLMGLKMKDLDGLLKEALKYGKEGGLVECYKILKNAEKGKLSKDFPVTYEVDAKTAGQELEDKLKGHLKKPVNGSLAWKNGKVTIIPDQSGEEIDIDATVSDVNSMIGGEWDRKGGAVQVTLRYTDAEITEETLSQMTDLLGKYSTYYGDSGSGRAKNVESGAKHVNGTFVRPGEEISVNGLMEPYTEENGYAMAASYENGEVVQSMGGGICQVSTTLYNALLRSELEITERYAHSMLVSYVEPSMDAAIADNVKDLKFKNNRQEPIYIEALLDGEYITFHVYGKESRKPERTLKFVSETIEKDEPAAKKFVASDDKIGVMYTKSSAHRGMKSQLWKVIYENGNEVKREKVNYSQYRASGATVAVGVISDDSQATDKMKAAIMTQDEDKIKAAISAIKNPPKKETEEPSPSESGDENVEEEGEEGQ